MKSIDIPHKIPEIPINSHEIPRNPRSIRSDTLDFLPRCTAMLCSFLETDYDPDAVEAIYRGFFLHLLVDL
jgi:hypothetical protein